MSSESIAKTYTVNNARDEYGTAGMKTVPLNPRDKRITIQGWQDKDFGPEDFTPSSNMGIQTGKVSGNLVVADLDTSAAVKVARWVLPGTLRSGHGEWSHYLYRCPDLPEVLNREPYEHKGMVAEFRANRHQIAVSPSLHPDGSRYQWENGFDPSKITEIGTDELRRLVKITATAALLADNLDWSRGAALALAGFFLRHTDEDTARLVLQGTAYSTYGPPQDRYVPYSGLEQILEDTQRDIDDDNPATGGGKLADEYVGAEVVSRIGKWWGLRKSRPSNDKPTDDVLRDRFLERHANHAYGQDEWKTFVGGIWVPEHELTVKRGVSRVLEDAKSEGVRPTASLVSSVAELTKIEVSVPDDLWDADPYAVVCANGSLHLPTRTLRDHSKLDRATQRLPYAYDPDAGCEVWEEFVRNSLPEEAEFLQECAGYCLTTDTALETALWMQGTRGSGKSTFLEGLLAMLGHRAGRLGLRDIEQSRFGLTGIQGRTLLVASEQPNLYLQSTDILDALISGEPVTVDRKYREPQTIRPVAKLVWAMNDLPRIGNTTSGIFRRVKVVKFPDPTNEPNPMVKEIIKTEGAGILNWALDGLNRLQNRGSLQIPASVVVATQEFQNSNDVPALYVAENCTTGPNMSVQAGMLYRDYKSWCEENGHKPLSSTRMAGEWQRLGFGKKQTNKGAFYEGISLV